MMDKTMLKNWAADVVAQYDKYVKVDKIRSEARIAELMGYYLCDRRGNYIRDKEGNYKGNTLRLRNELALARLVVKDTAVSDKVCEAAEAIGKMLDSGHLIDVGKGNADSFDMNENEFMCVRTLLINNGYKETHIFIENPEDKHDKMLVPVMSTADKTINYILQHRHQIVFAAELFPVDKTKKFVSISRRFDVLRTKYTAKLTQIIKNLADKGYSNKEIGEIVGVEESGVRNYRKL